MFNITPSKKDGLRGKDNYIVIRKNTVFLRIVGDYPAWTVMTATADEGCGINVCNEQLRLIKSALALGVELKIDSTIQMDLMGREYVVMFRLEKTTEESEDEFNEDLSNT